MNEYTSLLILNWIISFESKENNNYMAWIKIILKKNENYKTFDPNIYIYISLKVEV